MKHVNTPNNELLYFILLSKIISYDIDTFSFFHRSEKFLVSGSKASSSKEVNLGNEIRGQFVQARFWSKRV